VIWGRGRPQDFCAPTKSRRLACPLPSERPAAAADRTIHRPCGSPVGAPRNSGLRPERACDCGRMANHGPTAVGCGSPPRRHAASGPVLTLQCPCAAMRPQSQVGVHNCKAHPLLPCAGEGFARQCYTLQGNGSLTRTRRAARRHALHTRRRRHKPASHWHRAYVARWPGRECGAEERTKGTIN